MSEHQKIHPVEAENPSPTAPLAPPDSLASEKGDPLPAAYPLPTSPSKPRKRRSCCCKCLCWTIGMLVLLVILIAATVGILYLVFRPKLPDYTVDQLRITDFNFNPVNDSLYAEFGVTFIAKNPNKKIGIYYKDGSHLSVWYNKTMLCAGSWPVFYQGHRNTTVVEVFLAGENHSGSNLLAGLQEELQETGKIALDFRGKVPVRIKLGRLKLRKVKFGVKCKLVIDSLAVNNQIRVRTSSCKFKLKL